MPSRRGRPTKQDILRHAMDLFRLETVGDLEDASAFRECRGVLVIVRSLADHPRWAYGVTLDLLKQAACADVLSDLYAAGHAEEVRVARFIHAHFFEGQSVAEIARQGILGVQDRSHVSHTYAAEAYRLVAQRLLTLADHEDPLTESEGLRLAIALREQRRQRGAQRVSDGLQLLWARRHRGSVLPSDGSLSTSHTASAVQ